MSCLISYACYIKICIYIFNCMYLKRCAQTRLCESNVFHGRFLAETLLFSHVERDESRLSSVYFTDAPARRERNPRFVGLPPTVTLFLEFKWGLAARLYGSKRHSASRATYRRGSCWRIVCQSFDDEQCVVRVHIVSNGELYPRRDAPSAWRRYITPCNCVGLSINIVAAGKTRRNLAVNRP